MTIWVDASTSGASGDMLLGALLGAGVPLEVLQSAVDAAAPEPVHLRVEDVRRNGFAATRCWVDLAESHTHRTWREVREIILRSDLDEQVREVALAVFERLAVAEARVHGTEPTDVAFHEVGALDAIADVVGVCAGFAYLRAYGHDRVVVSTIAVGSGVIDGAHGTMPVPPPAVADLLRGHPSSAGPTSAPAVELCTPTGAALLTTLATQTGNQPAMSVDSIGVGAGGRDPSGHANIVRILVGTPDPTATGGHPVPVLIESNIDDLDPRIWPSVISALLEAGASDAWLTPILMKKGRPAHTLSVLAGSDRVSIVRAAIFRLTSTIGVREQTLRKYALDREMVAVNVDGEAIAVKLARDAGELVNAQPEWDDVAGAAGRLGRPASEVLADAIAASRQFFHSDSKDDSL